MSTQTAPSHTTEGPRRGMSPEVERREQQKRKWQEEVDRDERRELRWVGETKALRAEITSTLQNEWAATLAQAVATALASEKERERREKEEARRRHEEAVEAWRAEGSSGSRSRKEEIYKGRKSRKASDGRRSPNGRQPW